MFCKDGEYHPFAACLMFKESHDRNVVWANMNALMDRGREIERAIPKGNECMAALSRHNEQAAQSQDSTLAQLGDAADPRTVAACADEIIQRELAAAQERIRSLETELRIEKDACQITLAEATEEMKEVQERIASLEVSFRVNMLRLRPEMSHAEIDEIISRAGKQS